MDTAKSLDSKFYQAFTRKMLKDILSSMMKRLSTEFKQF